MMEPSAWKPFDKLVVEKTDEALFQWTCFKNCQTRFPHRSKPIPQSTVRVKDGQNRVLNFINGFFLSLFESVFQTSKPSYKGWFTKPRAPSEFPQPSGANTHLRVSPEPGPHPTKTQSKLNLLLLRELFLSTSTHWGLWKARLSGSFLQVKNQTVINTENVNTTLGAAH